MKIIFTLAAKARKAATRTITALAHRHPQHKAHPATQHIHSPAKSLAATISQQSLLEIETPPLEIQKMSYELARPNYYWDIFNPSSQHFMILDGRFCVQTSTVGSPPSITTPSSPVSHILSMATDTAPNLRAFFESFSKLLSGEIPISSFIETCDSTEGPFPWGLSPQHYLVFTQHISEDPLVVAAALETREKLCGEDTPDFLGNTALAYDTLFSRGLFLPSGQASFNIPEPPTSPPKYQIAPSHFLAFIAALNPESFIPGYFNGLMYLNSYLNPDRLEELMGSDITITPLPISVERHPLLEDHFKSSDNPNPVQYGVRALEDAPDHRIVLVSSGTPILTGPDCNNFSNKGFTLVNIHPSTPHLPSDTFFVIEPDTSPCGTFFGFEPDTFDPLGLANSSPFEDHNNLAILPLLVKCSALLTDSNPIDITVPTITFAVAARSELTTNDELLAPYGASFEYWLKYCTQPPLFLNPKTSLKTPI
jgi:hypothetical protein